MFDDSGAALGSLETGGSSRTLKGFTDSISDSLGLWSWLIPSVQFIMIIVKSNKCSWILHALDQSCVHCEKNHIFHRTYILHNRQLLVEVVYLQFYFTLN